MEQDAERPDVRASVHGLALGLLGRHVRRRAEDDPGPSGHDRERWRIGDLGRHGVVRQRLGETEVEDLDSALLGQLDVGGLQVAMDDAALVGVFERLRDLPRDPQGFFERDRALSDAVLKRRALDQLHDQRAGRVRVFEAVDRGDVRMIQRSQEVRLVLEAGHAVLVGGEGFRQDLDRYVAAELGVPRAVHLAARAERSADLVRAETCAGRQAHRLSKLRVIIRPRSIEGPCYAERAR